MDMRRLTGEAVLYSVSSVLEVIAAFLVMPIIGRHLTPEEWGIADIITATVGLLYVIVGMNLDQALIRYYYDEPTAERPRLTSTHALLIAFNGAIIVSLGTLALYAFRSHLTDEWAWLTALAGMFLVVGGDNVATLFRLRHEPASHVTLLATRAFCWAFMVALFLIGWDMGIIALFAGRLIGAVVAIAISVPRVRSHYVQKGCLRYAMRSLRFSVPTIPATLAAWAILHGPRYFLIVGASAEEVGYYGVGVRVGYLMSVVGTGVVMAWGPFVMGIKDQFHASATIGRGLLYFSVLNVLILLPLAVFSLEIVRVLIGPAYVPAHNLVGPMLAAAALSNVGLFLFVQLSISEQTHWQSVSYLAGAVVMAALNLLLIPHWQAAGSVAATVGGHVIMVAVIFGAAQRFFRVVVFPARTFGVVAVLVGVLGASFWIDRHAVISFSNIGLKILLVLVGWGLCILLLGRKDIESFVGMGRAIIVRRMRRNEIPGDAT